MSKPPPPNLPAAEIHALRKLKKNNKIVVLPADKGNATVVMDTLAYDQKIKSLLDDNAYLPVNKDPLPTLQKRCKEN